MENLIPYIKLIILALACLVTGVCTLNRKWYVNLPVFLICIAGETFMAYLFFPAYALWPACGSVAIFAFSTAWEHLKPFNLDVIYNYPLLLFGKSFKVIRFSLCPFAHN